MIQPPTDKNFLDRFTPPQVSKALPVETGNEVLKHFKDLLEKEHPEVKVTDNIAFVIMAMFLQCGGSIENIDPELTVCFDDYRYPLRILNAALKEVGVTNKRRELGFTFAEEIQLCMRAHGTPGFLFNNIFVNFAEKYEDGDEFYCSDIQSENPKCPSHVKRALLLNLNKDSNQPSTPRSKPTKRGGRRKK